MIKYKIGESFGECKIEYFVLFFVGLDDGYGVIGNGWCRAQCNDGRFFCKLNGYQKESSNHNDCKSACNNEPACTGFAASSTSNDDQNRCYVRPYVQ